VRSLCPTVGTLTLPGLDAFMKKAPHKHPAVGLRVTVSGAHPYSGYHGTIRDALGTEEKHFSVELEAKYQTVVIERKNLTLHLQVLPIRLISTGTNFILAVNLSPLRLSNFSRMTHKPYTMQDGVKALGHRLYLTSLPLLFPPHRGFSQPCMGPFISNAGKT